MHTNHLINESSPYLLQHAHNPVNWYPWGEEALTKAKEENKPILISIGYAACHWCHVMEKESFEDETTAALMNEHFINIKVDREERPDLDHIYMDAVQAISGSGGWPLNVFLTPECKPFFGGTYFPPVNAFNRLSWKEIINNVSTAFKEKKDEIESQAENLTQHLLKANAFGIAKQTKDEKASLFTKQNEEVIAENILKNADTQWGGFGNAPKFPQTSSIQYLLRNYHFTKNETALRQGLLSLDKMMYGGLYDQLGGGFARYSTDAKWLAPHFEKMLYDNALLINVFSEAYQVTKNSLYSNIIQQTIDFIIREMQSEEGGFYSALDADSEGVEGKFYIWSKSEIEELLQNDAAIYCDYYNVTNEGNWEHTNILWVQKPLAIFANENNINEQDFFAKIEACNKKLLHARSQRIRPLLDDKILLGWNALTVTALCKAYAATSNENYKQLAINNMQFLQDKLQNKDGSWQHTYKNGVAKISAFLDDYAFLIQAFIHLQEVTGNSNYLLNAKQITDFVLENFSDEEAIFFYFTNQHQTDIIVRKKEVYDGATPSGNAVMALNLYYLSIIFNNVDWKLRAEEMVKFFGEAITKYPTSFGVWASFVQQNVYGINEIIVTGKNFTESLSLILQAFIPNKILQATNVENNTFPLLEFKVVKDQNSFYLCKDYTCKEPMFNLKEFLANM